MDCLMIQGYKVIRRELKTIIIQRQFELGELLDGEKVKRHLKMVYSLLRFQR